MVDRRVARRGWLFGAGLVAGIPADFLLLPLSPDDVSSMHFSPRISRNGEKAATTRAVLVPPQRKRRELFSSG